MSTPDHDAESTPSDLLSHVEVEVGCNTCQTSYSVPGALIRDSQRILAAGCTGTSLFECDASYYATLIEPEVIANLERAWASFQQSATSHGGIGVALVCSETNQETNTQAIAPALQRWENEGGRCDQASVAPRRRGSDAS